MLLNESKNELSIRELTGRRQVLKEVLLAGSNKKHAK